MPSKCGSSKVWIKRSTHSKGYCRSKPKKTSRKMSRKTSRKMSRKTSRSGSRGKGAFAKFLKSHKGKFTSLKQASRMYRKSRK